jgi:hypothetical protein
MLKINKFIVILIFLYGCKTNDPVIPDNTSQLEDNKIIPTYTKPDIIIKPEAEKIVNETFSDYDLSESDINTLKEILSDPYPDPENKSGQNCGTITKNCKWDNRSFDVQTNYMTYQSLIELFSNPLGQLGIGLVSAFGGKEQIKLQIHELCEKFNDGNRYDCSEEIGSSEYCSEKCKYESKMAGH